MKNLICLSLIVFTLTACDKKHCDEGTTMTVVRNCTGVYLQEAGKMHNVCNVDALQQYKEGDKVKAVVKTTNSCPEAEERIVCMMVFPCDDLVRVEKVSKNN